MRSAHRFFSFTFLFLAVTAPVFAQHLQTQVPVGNGPSGIAVNPKTNSIYVANSADNSVSVIDGSSNTVIQTISVGNQPTTVVVYVPASLVYVYNAADISLSVIDGNSNTLLRTVASPFHFDAAALVGLSKWLYVCDTAANAVHVVDITTFKKFGDIAVTAPSAITIDAPAKTVYVTSAGSEIDVIDVVTHQVVDTYSVLNNDIAAISVDPVDKLLYAATTPVGSSNATVTTLDSTSGTVLGTSRAIGAVNDVRALPGAHKAVATGGKLVGQDVHSVIFIGGASHDVIGLLINVGKKPSNIALNANTKTLYTANTNSNDVAVIQ